MGSPTKYCALSTKMHAALSRLVYVLVRNVFKVSQTNYRALWHKYACSPVQTHVLVRHVSTSFCFFVNGAWIRACCRLSQQLSIVKLNSIFLNFPVRLKL